ncbi:MAG: hypothetical protein R3C43_19895 [Chloroflexota bacterium]
MTVHDRPLPGRLSANSLCSFCNKIRDPYQAGTRCGGTILPQEYQLSLPHRVSLQLDPMYSDMEAIVSEEAMWSNGINGSTGEYLSPLTDEEIVAMVKGRVINEEDLQATLVSRDSAQSEEFLGPKAGINANLIAEGRLGCDLCPIG